jgi:hypothetical protein
MSIILKKFNNKITTLKNEFEVHKDIVHQGVKGGLNENELSSLIKDVIPQKYRLTKGVIENAGGEQSNETDLLIYDDEVLPLYMKHDLTFVPVEAVKYNFEVKSKLDSTELKTTIGKFERFKRLGGNSPTVLFAFSSDMKGSELNRLRKNDAGFFINPVISVLCVSNKAYYYKTVTEHYLKDHLSNTELTKSFSKTTGLDLDGAVKAMRDLMSNNLALSQMSRSQFALSIQALIQMNDHMSDFDNKKMTINGIKFDEIKFKIHRWIGIEAEDNEIELSILSGISNTLSKGNFGSYLLSAAKQPPRVFAMCCEDMWGNLSCEEFDENGLSDNTDTAHFSFQSGEESSRIIFKLPKTEDCSTDK